MKAHKYFIALKYEIRSNALLTFVIFTRQLNNKELRGLECNTEPSFTGTVFPYLLDLKFTAIGNKFILHWEYSSRSQSSNL